MAIQKYDIPVRDKPGSFEEHFWCSTNKPVLDEKNQLKYIIHNAQNVTEFMRGDEDTPQDGEKSSVPLARINELESEVYRSAQSLQAANKKLKIANDAKTTFLASMSHELRTPLNAILGFAQFI